MRRYHDLKLFKVERVGQTKHGPPVLNLGETLRRTGAHALCWRVWNNQLRVFIFQPVELPHQAIVLGVARSPGRLARSTGDCGRLISFRSSAARWETLISTIGMRRSG